MTTVLANKEKCIYVEIIVILFFYWRKTTTNRTKGLFGRKL